MINQKNVSPKVSKPSKVREQESDSIIIDADDFNSICPASAINLSLLARTILHRPDNEDALRGIANAL